jgi:pilus assembly protein CpaE
MSLLDALHQRQEGAAAQNADFVALVADEANTAVMQRYVSQRMLPHALVQQGAIGAAIDLLKKMDRAPVQLVVDVSGLDTPLSELEKLSNVCDPSISVFVLGDRNDVGLYRSLLQLGIRDYLVKPLTVDLLLRTLGDGQTGHTAPVQHTRTGKVISFVGARGGVGVSSVCTHLAYELAENRQRRVAVVDLDLHGGAVNVLLGLQGNQGLIDVLENVQRLDPQSMDRTLIRHGRRLYVLSCELAYGDRFVPQPGALAQLIDVLKHYFHYVLLDVPRPGTTWPQLSEEAFDNSYQVYLLADATVHSARRAAQLSRHVTARQSEPVLSLLLNHPQPEGSARVEVQDFVSAIQRSVLMELPFDAQALTRAQNLGEALNPRSVFGMAIRQLANDLSGAEVETVRAGATVRQLDRLRQWLGRGG